MLPIIKGLFSNLILLTIFKTFFPATKIEYSENYPLLDWSSKNINDFKTVLKRKHKGWHYEKEWRLMYSERANNYLKFKPEALTGLIIGCKTDINFKKNLLNILKQRENAEYPALNIYSAIMHKNKYKLKMEKDRTLDWPT